MNSQQVLIRLKSNPTEVLEESLKTLLQIAENVLRNPASSKVRTLQKANSLVQKRILACQGAVECLQLMGFVEENGSYILPTKASLEKLKNVKSVLDKVVRDMENDKLAAQVAKKIEESMGSTSTPGSVSDSFRFRDDELSPRFANNEFFKSIESHFQFALSFGDIEIQTLAESLIPIQVLVERAQERVQKLRKDHGNDVADLTHQDIILPELMSWFKDEFFTWVDTLPCTSCQGPSVLKNIFLQPPDMHRVEVHECPKCHTEMPFPRYTNLREVLRSRKGRCGEWAQAFTLMCFAMGWEARFVVDLGDHVWTEIFSHSHNRWVHCDPCENAFDTPLMYENGWKKEISYVLAYSPEDVQDVTWRYTSHHQRTLSRRRQCREEDLLAFLLRLREKRQNKLTQARRDQLTKRTVLELVDLMVEKQPGDGDGNGRTSGDLMWRLQRGETALVEEKFVWLIDAPENLRDGVFTVRYSCAEDSYECGDEQEPSQVVNMWSSRTYSYLNMFRKLEKDWKIVYLTRNEGATEGAVSWKFEAKHKQIDKITLTFQKAIYESGEVQVLLESDTNQTLELAKDEMQVETNLFSGSKTLTITAKLMGGKGDVAWQHAQLFRQPSFVSKQVEYTSRFPFILTFTFK